MNSTHFIKKKSKRFWNKNFTNFGFLKHKSFSGVEQLHKISGHLRNVSTPVSSVVPCPQQWVVQDPMQWRSCQLQPGNKEHLTKICELQGLEFPKSWETEDWKSSNYGHLFFFISNLSFKGKWWPWFPCPASPMSTGLFFVLLPRIRMVRCNSSLRPRDAKMMRHVLTYTYCLCNTKCKMLNIELNHIPSFCLHTHRTKKIW